MLGYLIGSVFCQLVNCLFGGVRLRENFCLIVFGCCLSRVVGSSSCCLVVLGQEVIRQVMFGQEVV